MKKFLLFVAGLFSVCSALHVQPVHAQESRLTLEDITGGKYFPQYVYGVYPMLDGESYTQLSPDNKRIIRRSFKNGK